MPVTTPQIKIDSVAALGATVVLEGDSYDDAYAEAMRIGRRRRLTFVHPYDDPDVIAGQGTIAMEILRQLREPIDAIFVAVGGGGLIGGIAAYVKRLRPEIRIVGVEPADANAMERSLRARSSRHAPPRRPLRRRGRGEAGRRRAVPPRPPLRRRDDPRRHRRAVRRDEGRVRGHAHDRRAVGGARRRRREALRRAGEGPRAEPRHRPLRGEHELRPAPLRGRAGRPRRGPRGGLRGDDPGAARAASRSSAACSGAATSPSSTTATATRRRPTSSSA